MADTHGGKTYELAAKVGLVGALLLLVAGFLSWSGLDVAGADNVDGAKYGGEIAPNGWIEVLVLLFGAASTLILGAKQQGKELVAANTARTILISAASVSLLLVFAFIQALPDLTDEENRNLLAAVEADFPELKAKAVEAGHRILGFSLSLGTGLWLAAVGGLLLLGSQLIKIRHETYLFGALSTLLVGISSAIHLVGIKIDLLAGGTGNAGCQVSPGFDCGSVNSSAQSMMFGVPISLLALPTYALMGYLLITAWRGARSSQQVEQARGDYSLKLATAIGLLTVLYSGYLYYVSSVVIGKLCLFCIVLYGVNALTAVLLVLALRGNVLGALFDVLGSLKPVLPALGVFVIVGGISWVTYDDAQRKSSGDAQEEALESAKTQQESLDKNEEVADAELEALKRRMAQADKRSTPPPTKASATPGGQAGVATAPSKPVKTAKVPRAKRTCKKFSLNTIVKKEPPPPEKRGDGYRYYETPVDDDCDFIYGNPDALVTVVKYADFQCQYCKVLASAMKPIKEKYKDKVRFVMKQFPMNGKCNPRMGGYDKHPYACEAAYASHCAGEQGKFWEMHDKLYSRQRDLEPGLIRPRGKARPRYGSL